MHIAENHIDLRALRQLLRERFRALAEQGGVYPLRRLLAVFLLAVVVCQREIGDRVAACRVFQFCIAAQPHESGEDCHYAASFGLLIRSFRSFILSEERRVWMGCVSTSRARWSPSH